jgi:hypothetical protein
MDYNTDTTSIAVAATNASDAPYVFLSFMFQSLLEFLVLIFVVDEIGLSCLDVICSSTMLICMFILPAIFVVMIYYLFIQIKSYGNLLIYSTQALPNIVFFFEKFTDLFIILNNSTRKLISGQGGYIWFNNPRVFNY